MKPLADERSHPHLRRFGLTVATGLAIIGLVSWYRSHTVLPLALWAIAGGLLLLGLFLPRFLIPVQRAWMTLGSALGWINTRIILTVLFYVIFTPMGTIMRLLHDPLDRRLQRGPVSYWVKRGAHLSDPKSYERQF